MNEVLSRPVRAVVLTVATGLAAVATMAPVTAHSTEPWGFEQVTPVDKGAGVLTRWIRRRRSLRRVPRPSR